MCTLTSSTELYLGQSRVCVLEDQVGLVIFTQTAKEPVRRCQISQRTEQESVASR